MDSPPRIPRINVDVGEYTFSLEPPVTPNRPLRTAGSAEEQRDPINAFSPIVPPVNRQKTSSRANKESRKLLAHILGQLERRQTPPSLLDLDDDLSSSERASSSILETVKESTNVKKLIIETSKSFQQSNPEDDEADDDTGDEGAYSTDGVYELLVQLRDLLLLSTAQDWHILDDGVDAQGGLKSSSPFRRSRQSLQETGPRSRSPSPSQGRDNQLTVPILLLTCIKIIASLVLEECRFKISSPRPSRPPNALQSVVLDLARILVHSNRHDPIITSRIGFAVIPAFSTFPTEMHPRLICFFRDIVVQGALETLQQLQGLDDSQSITSPVRDPSSSYSESPLVSIHVESAIEDTSGATEVELPQGPFAHSSYVPNQSPAIYRLASIIAPLLGVILDSVELDYGTLNNHASILQFRRLLYLLFDQKFDAYIDMLQVIAYHTEKARRAAVSILLMHAPQFVGHRSISLLDNPDHRSLQMNTTPWTTRHRHQFTPWYFDPPDRNSHVGSCLVQDCPACLKPLSGFGLLCPFCLVAIHFYCFDDDEGNRIVQYASTAAQHVHRVAMFRFSNVLSTRTPLIRGGHTFRTINVFTIVLCFICQSPLLGDVMQGMNCSACMLFAHHNCLAALPRSHYPACDIHAFDSNRITIDWTKMHKAIIDHYRPYLQLPKDKFTSLGPEELSILHAVLQTQAQIISNGIALGSVLVKKGGRSYTPDDFELHQTIRQLKQRLSFGDTVCSNALQDYLDENGSDFSDHSLMFSWPVLSYVSSQLRLPDSQGTHGSPNLLSVTRSPLLADPSAAPPQSFDVVPTSHIYMVLQKSFNIRLDIAADLFISHLLRCGFLRPLHEPHDMLHREGAKPAAVSFPLPSGLDLSPCVETLVSAIEACLSDRDLGSNELGLLLLVRRCWPDGLTPEYMISRLLQSIISWILAEDDNLAGVLSDHLAKRKATSQSRSNHPKLPTVPSSEGFPIGSTDYLSTRRMLLKRYAAPWLQTLCNYDQQNFADMVYGACAVVSRKNLFARRDENNAKISLAAQSDNILRALSKLAQVAVVGSVRDDLIRQWLQSLADFDLCDQAMPSIPRLFTRETDSERPGQINNPWSLLISKAKENREGFARSIGWMYLISISKTELPPSLLQLLVQLASTYDDIFPEALSLVKSILNAAWSSSTPQFSIRRTVFELTTLLSASIIQDITAGVFVEDRMLFIRLCFATFLVAAGCDKNRLFELGLMEHDDISGPSLRKEGGRNTIPEDPLVVKGEFLEAISHYLTTLGRPVTCLVMKFLAAFLIDTPSLESHEGDNFILRNGELLATCLWEAYGIQEQTLAPVRARLLLRIFNVDPGPFENLLTASSHLATPWEQRLSAANRTFAIVLDIGNPAIVKEAVAQHQSVAAVFKIFFSMMWADPDEEIRASIETMCAALLPAHYDAISTYWDHHLPTLTPAERIDFINFLSQLQAYTATRKLLSWSAIISILESTEEEAGSEHFSDTDIKLSRVSALCFALQMASNGIEIGAAELLYLKYHLLQAFGFRDVAIVPLQSKHGFRVQFGELQELAISAAPCLHLLVRLLDSSRTIDLAAAVIANTNLQDEKYVTGLIGSVFVDVFLNLFCSLRDWTALPFLTLKHLLEGLSITINKHDFDGRALKHLQQLLRRTVSKSIELLSEEINQELRQIIMSVIQAFVQRWSAFMGSILYTSIEAAAQVIASQGSHGSDMVVMQATSYLQEVFFTYAQNGIFSNLFKRSLDPDFFWVLGEVLGPGKQSGKMVEIYEALLRDILGRIVENEQAEAQTMLKNFQSFAEKAPSIEMNASLASYLAHQLLQLSRRCIEWEITTADCNPILDILATMIKRNKNIARNFLPSSETILRILVHRSHLKKESLVHLLKEVPVSPRTSLDSSSQQTAISLPQLLAEILLDALRLKSRVPSPTLTAIIEALRDAEVCPGTERPATRSPEMLEAGVYYIQASNWFGASTADDFAASFAISKEVCSALLKDPKEIMVLFDRCAERLPQAKTTVRAWNTLLMAALSGTHPQQHLASLLSQLSIFSGVHHRGMQAYLLGQGWGATDVSLVDLNHGYIAIKLWVLLAAKSSLNDNDGEVKILAVWNELWPPFENLIRVLESQSQMDQNMTFTTLLISSIADLFIFLRGLNTPIGLNASYQIAVLNRLQNLGVETTIAKLNRAFKYMSDLPPETPEDVLMDQIAKDIIAAERLRLLETKVQVTERRIPERQRREYRVASSS